MSLKQKIKRNRVRNKIIDFIPEKAEVGVGLVLQDKSNRYIFFVAGERHKTELKEIFVTTQ